MQNSFHQSWVKAVGDDRRQRVVNQLLDFFDIGASCVTEAGAEHQLFQIRLQAGGGRHILAQSGVDKRHAQGAGRAAHQQARKNLQHQRCFNIQVLSKKPRHRNDGFTVGRFGFIHRVCGRDAAGFCRTRLACDCRIYIDTVEAFEHFLQKIQVLACGDVAIDEKARVGWRVVPAMKVNELFVGERRDHLRVAAGIQRVNSVGVHVFLDGLEGQRIGGRISSFHLVIDDAGNDESAVQVARRLELQMMSLLHEGFLEHPRVQHQIGVNPCQIVKISLDLTGHRIKGFVRIGEGIDKCLHARPRQLLEGVFEGIFFRTGQHRMLQNVRKARGVGRRRAKADRVEVFTIERMQVQNFRACLYVFHFISGKTHRRYRLDP